MDRDGYTGPTCAPSGYGWACPTPTPTVGAPPHGLPVTGAPAAVAGVAGLGAVLVGALVVVAARRARRRAS